MICSVKPSDARPGDVYIWPAGLPQDNYLVLDAFYSDCTPERQVRIENVTIMSDRAGKSMVVFQIDDRHRKNVTHQAVIKNNFLRLERTSSGYIFESLPAFYDQAEITVIR